MAQASMTVRIDRQQKAIFDELCDQFGMSANTAINIFVRTVIRHKRIPFIISAENEPDTRTKAIEAFERMRSASAQSDIADLSLDEINAEINTVRTSISR